MKQLVEGALAFSEKREYRAQISKLAEGQKPKALFITCSDSRLEPSVFTQANPGTLFVLRNVGNIIPPMEAEDDAITAALEFAVLSLKIAHIVVCGHSGCGAMEAVQHGAPDCPHVEKWIRHAAQSGENLAQANVLKQLEHLKTYPFINNVELHGWWFDIKEAIVHIYDPVKKQFSIITR